MKTASLAGAMALGLGLSSPVWSTPTAPPLHRVADAELNVGRSWVFLRDKDLEGDEAMTAALANLGAQTDERTIRRRVLRRTSAGLFDERDLPVSEAYAAGIEACGAQIHVRSKWLNAVSVTADEATLARIAGLPFVDHVEPVRAGRRSEDCTESAPSVETGSPTGGVRGGAPFEGIAYSQQAQIGVTDLHLQGFTGQGVIIGVLDTGFRRQHVVFNDPSHPLVVIAEHDFVFNDGQTANEAADASDQHNHGSWVLSLMAAYQPGVYCGAAYDAAYILCKTEDVRSETPIEEDNYVAGLEFIEAHGGDLATSSLGYIDWYTQANLDGATAVTSIAVNTATDNGLVCITAAGNEGHDADPMHSHLIAPADALRVITVGGVDLSGATVGFSSDGPSADGRVKPEVLAMALNNWVARVGNNTDFTDSFSGTSFATPLTAGAVACILQAQPAWTVEQVRTALMCSASDYRTSGHSDPLFVRGYGVVNAALAAEGDCDGDSVSDAAQIAANPAVDCNGNGIPDLCDIATHHSQDADQDGRPDECGPSCSCDWNAADGLDSQDFFDFLDAFFSGDADFNRFDGTDSQDLFDFLDCFFTGC